MSFYTPTSSPHWELALIIFVNMISAEWCLNSIWKICILEMWEQCPFLCFLVICISSLANYVLCPGFYWNMHLSLLNLLNLFILRGCLKNAAGKFLSVLSEVLECMQQKVTSLFLQKMNVLKGYLVDHSIIGKVRKLDSENRAALREWGQTAAQTTRRNCLEGPC